MLIKKKNYACKRILLVSKNPVGGIRAYFKYIYSMDMFNDYSYVIVTPENDLKEFFASVFSNKDYIYVETNNTISGFAKGVWKILLTMRFDLVHSHGFTAGLLISPLAKLLYTSHMMTTHEILLSRSFEGIQGGIRRKLTGLGLKLIDCTMTVSNDARDNLEMIYPKLEKPKLLTIHNGIDVDYFSKEKYRDLHSEIVLDKKCILFGFFGRFMEPKGFRYLIDAVKSLKEMYPLVCFKVAVFGWGGYIREEQDYINSINVEDLFHFFPHTDDMPSAIRGVNAVVMPSIWEACPLLPMEAMVSGVTLIASDCVGLREVTLDAPVIIFKHGSSNELHKALKLFLDNPEKYTVRANGYVGQASERYDARESAQQLLLQYKVMMMKNKKIS